MTEHDPTRTSRSSRSWRDSMRATNEDTVVSWVLRALEEGGATVTVLGRPERDATLRPHLRRRPDYWVAVDGIETAIEVTGFRETIDETTRAQAAEVQQTTQQALAGHPRNILLTFGYDAAGLNKARPEGRERGAAELAEATRAAVAGLDEADDLHLTLDGLPSWVRDAAVAVSVPSWVGARVRVFAVARLGAVAPRVDAFIRDRIASKGDQHVGWGRGVLVISHGIGEDADDLAAGFARLDGPMPWWRVYWTDAQGHAYVVAPQPEESRS